MEAHIFSFLDWKVKTKNAIRSKKIEKLKKTDTPKSAYSDSKTIFKIFKAQKLNSKN